MNFPEFVGLVKTEDFDELRKFSTWKCGDQIFLVSVRVILVDRRDRNHTNPTSAVFPGIDIAQNQTVVALLFESRRDSCGTTMENVISVRVISVCGAGGRIFIRFRI